MSVKLSVIVPIYNVEKYLAECIESLVKQTMTEMEIILVDDGSTDSSAKIAKKYSETFEKISFVSKKNGGLSDARNYGVQFAKGEYITFFDSDDVILINDAYEKMYDIARRSGKDIINGNSTKLFSDGRQEKEVREDGFKTGDTANPEEYLIAEISSNRVYVSACISIYKKSFIEAENLKFKKGYCNEDEDFAPRAILKSNGVAIYNEYFYGYRQREGSIMNSYNPKTSRDGLEVYYGLSELVDQVKSEELKELLRNYLAMRSIYEIDKMKSKDISKKIRRKIKENSVRPKQKIKAYIMNISMSLYLSIFRVAK
ncbi:MAG: glycosyltransferase [Sarcina sp.]